MPKILHDLVNKLIAHGTSESSAWAIATSALQKQGKLQKGSQKVTGTSKKVKKRR